MRSRHQLLSFLGFMLVGLLFSSPSQGFIEREYTIHEILDACTNIVFGRINSVDAKRLRCVVAVEKDLKGKSNHDEIKMNFATGQYRLCQSLVDWERRVSASPAMCICTSSGR